MGLPVIVGLDIDGLTKLGFEQITILQTRTVLFRRHTSPEGMAGYDATFPELVGCPLYAAERVTMLGLDMEFVTHSVLSPLLVVPGCGGQLAGGK